MKRNLPDHTVRFLCEALEERKLLGAQLQLNGAQAAVPGATINVSAFVNSPASPDIAASQSEMVLVVNPTNPLNLVGFSHRIPPFPAQIVMDLYRSIDGGTTWTTTQIDTNDDGLDALGNRYDPALAFGANGTLYIAYGYRGQAVAPLRNSRLVAAVSTDGGLNFTNFNNDVDIQADIVTPSTTDNDLPGVDRWTLATGLDGHFGNPAAYITYTQNVTEGSSTDQRIVIVGTRDGGANWSAPAIINDGSINGTNGGGLGAIPVVFGAEVFVTWWDVGTTLMADRDRDGIWANVFEFGTDLTVVTDSGLVNYVAPAQPQRRVRFSPSLAVNAVTRDLYLTCHQLIGGTGSDSDILFGRSSNFGDTWTWTTVDAGTGTEFNPSIAWDEGSGALGIAYYSTEGDQNNGNDDVRPRMALSTDNGNIWSRTFLSTQTSNETGGSANDYLEYNGFVFHDGTAHHLWASRSGGTDLDAFTTRVSLDSATNNNVLRIGGIGGAPDDSTLIRRAPANNNFVEVIENGVRTYAGLLASIDSITIETGGGVHAFGFENLPAIPVNMLGGNAPGVITISSLGGVSGLTFNGRGEVGNTITLGTGAFDTNTVNSPVTIFGGTAVDRLVIGSGNADAVAANVTFDGGPGAPNEVVYNDSAQAFPLRYDVFPNKVNRDGINAPFDLLYSNVNTFTIHLGDGSDKVTIRSGVTAVVHAFGNGGGDIFTVGGGNMGGFFPQDLNGGPGTDTITYDDSANPSGKTWDINGILNPNEIIYSGLISLFTRNFESVGILAGTGTDFITFSNNVRQNYSVDTGGGSDTVLLDNINNQNRPDGTYPIALSGSTGVNDRLVINDRLGDSANYLLWPTRLFSSDYYQSGIDITYRAFDNLQLLASDNDTVTVYGTSPDITGETTVYLGGTLGVDTVVVYTRDISGNPSLITKLGIVPSGGNDTVSYINAIPPGAAPAAAGAATNGPDSPGVNWSIRKPAGLTTTTVSGFGAPLILADDVASLKFFAGDDDDTIDIDTPSSVTDLSVDAGAGDDVVRVANSPGVLSVKGGDGYDQLSETFSLIQITPDRIAVTDAAFIHYRHPQAGSPQFLPFRFTNYSGVEGLGVQSRHTSNLLEVISTQPGSAVTLTGNIGDDAFVVGSRGSAAAVGSPATVDAIRGTVLIVGGQGGTDTLTVNDVANSVDKTVHLDQFTLGSHPGDTLFGPGGGLYFVGVSSLSLGLGGGADTLYVQPNAVADVSVDAGGTPGDALYLALAAAVNPVVSEDGAGGGTVTSDDDRTLTFSGFDQLAGTDDIAPAAVSAEYLPDDPEPALRVLFSEDVSPSLIPHSFVLRDDATGERVSPNAMALAYDAGTNAATLTFPGLPGGRPADGDYTLTLLSGSAADLFGNVTAADFAFEFAVRGIPAAVEQVFVGGSGWSESFRTHLQAQGLGGADGFALPSGPGAESPPLPWANLDQITLRFNRDVEVRQEDLAVRGITVADYPVSAFAYESSTHTATWTLASSITNDRLTLALAAGVTGAAAAFAVNVLPGDTNRNGAVLADDFSSVKRNFFATPAAPGYSAFHDVDGSGVILANDFSEVKRRFFNRLPDAPPAATVASVFADTPVADTPTRMLTRTPRRGVLDAAESHPLA
jgi:hypothetical protein